MTVQTISEPKLVVVLTDDTQVSQVQGLLKARRKEMSMAALIPSLQVQVEGTYNAQNQLVASYINSRATTWRMRKQSRPARNPRRSKSSRAKRNRPAESSAGAATASLAATTTANGHGAGEDCRQSAEIEANQARIDANKAAIAAANKRFGQLDDYNIMDEVTVYFGNGKVALDPKYEPQLLQLVEKAKTITAFMIQVKGYASSTGSASLNQKLSEDRANSVVQFLLQQGHVPLTNMLAPGAMGESRQVGNDQTAEGEAQNRRVVVRVLQNKGVAGT